ncbi:beta-galactosidase GalA [Pelagicoccus mobilis]|uniref:beta-galactosidase GalA n=1 Tax=Pelagicoccus mobilis TaxID=415221 RepID=UPI0035EBB2A1
MALVARCEGMALSVFVGWLFCFLAVSQVGARERVLFNDDWRFALGHASDRDADMGHAKGYFSYLAKTGYGDGPADPVFDDRHWRKVDLPHDWAVEMDFDPTASFSHGFKKVGPGFPENCIGWYRKRFTVSEVDFGKRIFIEFDGIYRNAAVFVNGFFVGQEPSGFVSQRYDITEYLKYGDENVLSVRADASTEEGWYYEGAGIYRHVYLLKTDSLRVARYGTFVKTSVEGGRAHIKVETTVENDGRELAEFKLQHAILDANGREVAKVAVAESLKLEAGENLVRDDELFLSRPKLWDLDTPYLYTLKTRLVDSTGVTVDEYDTTFGVREIRFDPNKGFFLNGRSVKLKGSNNHHDHAGVGAALPDSLKEFRIRKLKEMGSNAYRVSHHHASPALLEICDRMGMLVIDETRLMGINEYHFDQLEHLIKRGRNHPSIIMWSIGNEEWAIEGNIFGARITTRMQDFAKRLDPTRPTTAAISGGWGGTSTTVEAMGVNYIRHGDVDRQHAEFPDQIILGTEETTTQQTRGIYVENAKLAHQPPIEDGSSGGNAELGWRFYAERDYTAGVFFWTGFDYRGEPTPYEWPAVLSQFGILDNCGFPKDGYFYLKSWWSDEPELHIFPHWNWPDRMGETIEVRAHSNCEEVELFLNGESLGRKTMVKNDRLAWDVVYDPGELKAVGFRKGKATLEKVIRTTGTAVAYELDAERSEIFANGEDVSVVTMRILDAAGDVVPTADDLARFEIEGPGRIIGVGNGNPSSLEADRFVPSVESFDLGEWDAPAPWDEPKPLRFEAVFDAPNLKVGQSGRLYLNVIGRDQVVHLNGEALPEGTEFALANLSLKPEGNMLTIDAQPFEEWGAKERVAKLKPAFVGVFTPAEGYRRKAFNGLAQVIVQSSGEAGEIVLRAVGELETATVRIKAKEH